MSDASSPRHRWPMRRVAVSILLIPLLALASVAALFAVFQHPTRAHAATLPTPWWHHLNGERELDAVRFGYTLQDVQNNLSTYAAEGYQVINLDWPIQAGPVCIYGGFSASDYYHTDPHLAASGTNADTDWTNFVTAIHNQGMAVNSWFNPSYLWTGSALFKQAEADVRMYGTDRANQPANSPARYFEWRSQTGSATKPADNFCGTDINTGSYYSNRWVTDPDAGSNVSYYGVWSDQPSGDYASSEWTTYITGALKHWIDTGIDGFVLDAPSYYVNCDSACVKTTLVGTVHAYQSNVAVFGEGPSGGSNISSFGFDGVENTSFSSDKPWTSAISNQNPSSIETSATLSDRDGDVSVGGTSYEQFAPGVLNDNTKNLLAAATLMGTGNYLEVQSPQATSDSDGSQFGEFGTWPSDSITQASFVALTNAMRTNAALDSSGARAKVSTNNDNAYYAFVRTSPDASAKAVAVLNYTASQQTITVNVSNQNIADGATTNLVGSGGTPTISSGSFSVTLPAWGYGFYGVTLSTCATNLCGTEGSPAASTNLTTEGTSDWGHWGANNSTTQYDHRSSGGNQLSLSTTGTVSWYNNNPNTFSWSDGTPTSSASNDTAGLWIAGMNNGFTLTAPADTTTRTLRVYVGVWKAQSKLTATLSDSSASSYMDTTLNNSTSTTNGEYTFTYKANSASQHLTMTFALQTSYDTSGNVTLQAATLQQSSTVTTIDDTASGWTWTNFPQYSDPSCLGGTAHGGQGATGNGQYTFTGTGVQVYGWKGDGGGSIQVLIDGVSQGTFSEAGTGDNYHQLLFSTSGLTSGSHTLKVVGADGANWNMVDDIKVTN